MRMTTKDNYKRTETFNYVLENFTPIPPSNVILTLSLLQKNQGGEMYGM